MVARAVCGSAFSAWPPSSSVGTQVVRSIALKNGDVAPSRRAAASSAGSTDTARMSAASAPDARAACAAK